MASGLLGYACKRSQGRVAERKKRWAYAVHTTTCASEGWVLSYLLDAG
jgi:hypothetical protein